MQLLVNLKGVLVLDRFSLEFPLLNTTFFGGSWIILRGEVSLDLDQLVVDLVDGVLPLHEDQVAGVHYLLLAF